MSSIWFENRDFTALALEAEVTGLIESMGDKAWAVADAAVRNADLPPEARDFYLKVRDEIEKQQGRGATPTADQTRRLQ